MRIVRRILLLVTIVVLVVVGAAILYLNSSAAQRQLRAFVLREVNEHYGIPTEFDNIEVRFFPLSVTVYGLRVSHPTEGRFLEARALTITPDPWSLLRGRYRFEEVALVEPHLHLKVRDGKLVNLPQPRAQTGTPPPAPLVDAFALVDGRADIDVQTAGAAPATIRLSGVNLDLTGSRNEVFELRALISGGTVQWGRFVRPLRRFEARVGLTPAELRLRRLALELGDDVRLLVDRGVYAFGPHGEVHVAARAALPLDALDQLPASLGLPALAGTARVDGQADFGTVATDPRGKPRWTSRFALACGKLRVGDTLVGDLDGKVELGTDGLRAEGLRLDSGIGRLTIDGTFRFAETKLPFDGKVKMERLEFAPLLERLGVPRSKVTQTFDGTIAVTGTARPFFLLAHADTDVTNFGVYGRSFRNDSNTTILDLPLAHATGGITLDKDKLTIIPTDAVDGASKHLVTGMYRFADHHFTLDIISTPLDTADLGELLEIGVAGSGPAHTHIDGPMDDITIDAEMAFRDFRYLDKSFGNVRANLHYYDGVLSFPEIHAATGDSRYDVDRLTFDLSDGRPNHWTATTDIVANPIRVRDVPAVLRSSSPEWNDLDGFVEGRAQLTYRSWLDAFDVKFDGRAQRVVVRGEPLDAVSASGEYSGGVYRIPRFRLERLGGWLAGDATIGPRRRVRAEFHGEGLPLHRLFGGALAAWGLEGEAAVHGELGGTVDALAGRATATVTGTKLRGRPLGDLALDAFLDPGPRLRVVGGTIAGGLRFDALADLAGRARVGATVEFADLDALRFVDDPRLAGYALHLTGRTSLVADFGRGVHVQGRADLDGFTLDTPRGPISATDPVWLSYGESGVEFLQGDFAAPGGSSFRLLGYAGTDRLNLDFAGRADLALLAGLLPAGLPEATGRIEFGARLTGTLDEPQLVGSIGLHGGRLALGAPYGDVSGIEAALTLTPSQISIDRCAGEFLGGRVRLSGQVALAHFAPDGYDLGLDFGGLTWQLTPTLPVSFDGTLRVAGTHEDLRPLVTGDVYVTRLNYTDPVHLGVSLADLGRPQVETVPTFRPEDDKVRFDVRLHGDGLTVRNNLIEAGFHIDDTQPFRVVGTNQLYGMVGTVVIDHGQMTFRHSVFDVSRGIVTFDSPWKVDPRFDVVAETEVRDWRITLTATGRRNNLRLLTTSDPNLSEDDIVLLLTVGMTREEVELLGTQGAVSGALAEVVDEALGVSERVGHYVPIFDQMRLTTEYSPRTGRSEPRITVGKRISDQVRVEASSAVTDSRDFQAVFSYEVTDRLSIQGVYDNNNDQQFGNVGADVRWRIEF